MPFFVSKNIIFKHKMFIHKEVSYINGRTKPLESIIKISKVDKNKIYLSNGTMLNVLKVEPINFRLKSTTEKNSILEAYKCFLKSCNFDFQIFIQTEKMDVKEHIEEVKRCIVCEPELLEIADDYINFIKEISNERGCISRKFYIILNSKTEDENNNLYKIIDGLKATGNVVTVCETKEIIKILHECYKTKVEK